MAPQRSGEKRVISREAGRRFFFSFALAEVGLRSREISLGSKSHLLRAVKLRQPLLQLLLLDLSLDHRGSEFVYHVLRSLFSEIGIPKAFPFRHNVFLKPVDFLRKPSNFRPLIDSFLI